MVQASVRHECALLAVGVNGVKGETSTCDDQNDGAHEGHTSSGMEEWSVLGGIAIIPNASDPNSNHTSWSKRTHIQVDKIPPA